MTEHYLLYNRHGHVTGERLGNYLGIPHGREMPETRVNHLIRWGNADRIAYIPEEQTWNLRTAVARTTDKLQSLREMDEADIPVPPYSTDHTELDTPMLARATSHARGNDIELILQERDLQRTEADYYTEYIPTEREYRVHVIDGRAARTLQKVPEGDEPGNNYIRNHGNGWIFVEPREENIYTHYAIGAVDSLGLHFGAVDMIISEEGNPYILEVNTAPSLNDTNLELYGEHLKRLTGLDDVPGMENVDWSDRDDVVTEE